MRESLLPFHIPDITSAEIDAVTTALKSHWLTSGPNVLKLQQNFSAYTGAKHALAVNSCTAALHLALEAAGIKAGDEVLLPTMTFTATAEAVLYLGAKPILVDTNRGTLNIDLADIDRKLNSRTKMIIPVHIAGLACEMSPILEMARSKKIWVVEDAAHSFPTRYRGKFVGNLGDITCFSFYATKTVTTGEGGMLTTNNDEIAERVQIMRQHGIDRSAFKRSRDLDSWYYEVLNCGFKYNLSDILAALGVVQLERAEEMRRAREKIAGLYFSAFKNSPEIVCPLSAEEGGSHAWHLFTIKLDLDRLKISRNEFIRELGARNIGSSVHFIPLHLHPFYRKSFGYKPEDFPNASWLSERILSLPIFPSMTSQDTTDVIEAVHEIILKNKR